MGALRQLVVRGLTLPGVRLALRRLVAGQGCVFMLHRFAVPDLGLSGHDPDTVRKTLEHLRKERFRFVALRELLRDLAEGRPAPDRAVSFTIDDGYFDHAAVAAPLFSEFDCPVTTFVCTGFVDRKLWMWWDRIEYAFRETKLPAIRLDEGSVALSADLSSESARLRARLEFTEACKRVPERQKLRAIEALARAAEIELPDEAPPEFAPMSWDDLRTAERSGMAFGPHTVTHPVLSRTNDDQALVEIRDSRARLAREAADPVDVFCYPNGQPGDFGEREFQILSSLGVEAAVVGYPGYASRSDFTGGPSRRFTVPRFGLPSERTDLLQCVEGVERLKTLLRGEERHRCD
jgi:peptidoglycan/xylan/chitin deacetylase (PgdA/CDA1 family)